MAFPCTGVILAGGRNSRFNGTNKAFLEVGGTRILDQLYGLFTEIFEEVILVTNDPLAYLGWDLTIVTDIFSERSSLTGIHAGLFAASHQRIFAAACDAPFLNRDLVVRLLEAAEEKYDVVIPVTAAGYEPLCAVYSKRCLKPMAAQLQQKRFKIMGFFKSVRVREFSEAMVREIDPDLISFFNINRPEDLVRAQAYLNGERVSSKEAI